MSSPRLSLYTRSFQSGRCRGDLLPVRQDRHHANLTANSVYYYVTAISDSITRFSYYLSLSPRSFSVTITFAISDFVCLRRVTPSLETVRFRSRKRTRDAPPPSPPSPPADCKYSSPCGNLRVSRVQRYMRDCGAYSPTRATESRIF